MPSPPPPAAVGDAVGAGRVPRHADEERAVVAVVGRPPVLRRRHHLLDVGAQRVEVELRELASRSRSRRRADRAAARCGGAPSGRAGRATSRGWTAGGGPSARGRRSRGSRSRTRASPSLASISFRAWSLVPASDAVGAAAPVDDLGLVDLVARVVGRGEARHLADRAVDVDGPTAGAADEVVVVVADAVLVAGGRARGLDAPDDAGLGQRGEHVVDGLARDRAELGADRGVDLVGGPVRGPRPRRSSTATRWAVTRTPLLPQQRGRLGGGQLGAPVRAYARSGLSQDLDEADVSGSCRCG